MLLPLDLAALAWRHSHLTPELALGWRLGRHAHEWFDGLDRVRIAATGHEHTLTALRRLARFPEPGAVVQPAGPRPWDMLFLHEPTGTALKSVCISRRISLPRPLGSLRTNWTAMTQRSRAGIRMDLPPWLAKSSPMIWLVSVW